MRITFSVAKNRAKPLASVYISVTGLADAPQLRKAIGLVVDPNHWDAKKQRLKSSPSMSAVNTFLNEIEAKVLGLDAEIHKAENRKPKHDEVAALFGASPKSKADVTFAYALYHWQMRNGATLSDSHVMHKLPAIVKAIAGFDGKAVPGKVDAKWAERFAGYLLAKGLANGTIKKHVHGLRTLLKESRRMGVALAVEPESIEFDLPDAQPAPAYLTTDEMQRFLAVPPVSHMEEVAQDLFAFGYYTAKRFSEIQALTQANYDRAGRCLRIVQLKTKQENVVPLVPAAVAIIDRWHAKAGEGRLLPKLSNQQANVAVKMLACRAGIDEPFEMVHYSGSKRTVKVVPKWKAVSFHKSRHSSAMRILEKTGSLETTSAMLGHQSLSATRRYARMTADKLREQIEDVFGKD